MFKLRHFTLSLKILAHIEFEESDTSQTTHWGPQAALHKNGQGSVMEISG